MKISRVGVLTSGGDAPGMNAAIRAVVRTCIHSGMEIMGIRSGYEGLINGSVFKMDARSVANILQRGGSILGTSRCPEFRTREGRKKAFDVLVQNRIDALIVIGGEGSFKGAYELVKETNFKVIGIPASIDNDIYGTDYAIGFDTAVNTAVDAVDKIRDTAMSLERVFFIEVMGRNTGFIAAEVGLACGAESILVPEVTVDSEKVVSVIRESERKGKKCSIVVVAEGDESGGAMKIAEKVKKELNIDPRVTILGHIQRGGSPTARDRVLASRLGYESVNAILTGKSGGIVGEINNRIVFTPFLDVITKHRVFDRSIIGIASILAE
jgi:6-phosphofructokinase 1